MIGLGTIINVAAIVFGGICGLLFGKLLKPRIQDTLMVANGVCVLFLGIAGAMEQMLSISEGQLTSGGTMMLIVSIVAGAFVGEILNIEGGMERFGEWLKIKTHSEKDNGFVDGFVTASLTVCIGAMAIVGAISDGILRDPTILITKAILDLVIVMIMTASKGKGCIFSAIPVGLFQGTITLLATFIEPIFTKEALANLSLTGSVMIFCVGVNLVFGKKVKVANFLPAIVISVAWAFLVK